MDRKLIAVFEDYSGPAGKDGKKRPTKAEARLIEAAAQGVYAKCEDLPDDERIVSQALIVALGQDRFKRDDEDTWRLHARGLKLGGAQIPARLEADMRVFPAAMMFWKCRFKEGMAFTSSTIDGKLLLDECVVSGECDFSYCAIKGQFGANQAVFENPDGKGGFNRSIRAQGVQAVGWFMNGAKVKGEFDINSAVFSGQFSATRAEFKNPSGQALRLEFAEIRGGLFLALFNGSRGARLKGILNLGSSKISVRAQLAGAKFDRGSKTQAISLKSARIEGRLVMPNREVSGIVDLSRAYCDVLEDVRAGWPKPLLADCDDACRRKAGELIDSRHLVLDGFTYNHLEYPAGDPKKNAAEVGEARVGWLSGQSRQDLKDHFNPQPWRHCAQVLRAAGYDEAAREVDIAMRIRKRAADGTTRIQKLVSHFLQAVADFGHNPWKTVGYGAGVILFCAAVFAWGVQLCGGLDGLESAKGNACKNQPIFVQTKFSDFEEVTTREAPPDQSKGEIKGRPHYPEFSVLAFSVDSFVPFLDLGMESYWRPNEKAVLRLKVPLLQIETPNSTIRLGTRVPVGWFLYLLTLFEILAGSLLIAIAISGFTGFLARSEQGAGG